MHRVWRMFKYFFVRQVTFSTQSLEAMSELSQTEQLLLVEKLSSLSTDILSNKGNDVGKFSRKGMTYYRLRLDGFRIYFERDGQALHCQFILEKNSFQDFMVRCNLPASDEAVIENHQSFWDYLESLKKK